MGRTVIVGAARTPVGKRGGVLAGMHPAELLGGVQAALLDRAGYPRARTACVTCTR